MTRYSPPNIRTTPLFQPDERSSPSAQRAVLVEGERKILRPTLHHDLILPDHFPGSLALNPHHGEFRGVVGLEIQGYPAEGALPLADEIARPSGTGQHQHQHRHRHQHYPPHRSSPREGSVSIARRP